MLKSMIAVLLSLSSQMAFAADVPHQMFIEIKDKDAGYVVTKERYDFDSPRVRFNDGDWTEAKLHTRGEHCVRPARKCMGLTTQKALVLPNVNGERISGKSYVLTSLTGDNGYINTKTGSLFLNDLGLFPSPTMYFELFINGKTQGLYLLMENPEKILTRTKNTPFVARRGFKNVIEVKYFDEKQSAHTQEDFVAAFDEIYANLKVYKGQDLYEFLRQRINIDKYMKWLALSYSLKNGDFTDELFIFSAPNPNGSGEIYFDIAGWDFEDLFMSPHLSLRNIWYRDLIKSSLVYSLEDALERRIAKDPVLNQKYRVVLANLLANELSISGIREKYRLIREEISPYLSAQRILAASALDSPRVGVYTKKYILDLIDQRVLELTKRREKTLKVLSKD